MGGNMLIRTVGRAAGSTTPASSTSFCSACTGRVPRPSSLRTVCGGGQNATLSHQAACTGSESELEDWEFADEPVMDSAYRSVYTQDSRLLFSSISSVAPDSGRCDENLPSDDLHRYVFGLPPTFEEARSATSDLQAAFMESVETNDEISIRVPGSMTLEHEVSSLQESQKISHCKKEEYSDGWIEPHVSSNLPVTQAAKNPVYEAFQLLQNNSYVKDAVMSLASDSNVWHAMMKNKEMQELRLKLKKPDPCLAKRVDDMDTHAALEVRSEDEGENPFGGVRSALCAIVKVSMGIVCRVQNDLAKLIVTIMSLLNKTNHSSTKEALTDKASSSTMMLAVFVVVVVLMKRLTV